MKNPNDHAELTKVESYKKCHEQTVYKGDISASKRERRNTL